MTVDLGAVNARTAREVRPDLGRAEEALRTSFSMGFESRLTRHNSVEALVPSEAVGSTFDVAVVPKTLSDKLPGRATGTREFLGTNQELRVPDDLQDTIAFAYIPSPPEFFAVTPVAPKVSVHHLTLDGVVGALRAGRCHRRGWAGRGIRVAMTDTGFANHPYFEERGYTIVRAHTPGTSHPMLDTSGHGTGESANVLAVAPDVTFIGVKHDDYSAMALETALDQNPDIITNSWGWDVDGQTRDQLRNSDPNLFNEFRDLENIIEDAISDGVTVIFSAGNGHRAFPASLPSVLAVGGATVSPDGSLKASTYSSSFRSALYPGRAVPDVCGVVGEFNDTSPMKGHIALPVPSGCELEGKNLPNSKKDKGWGIFSGTSASAPQIAGVAALMLCAARDVERDLAPDVIRALLSASCRDVTLGTSGLGDDAGPGVDLATGAGFVDAFEACLLASQP